MVYINGPLETVAQELNGNHLSIDMQDKLYQNIAALAGKDIDAAKAYVLQISDETQEAIDKLPYSASTRQLLTINNKLITNAMLSSVASILTSAALHANLIKREEANNYYQELARKVPANYVSDEDMSILNVPQESCPTSMYKWLQGMSNGVENWPKLGNRQRYLLRYSPQCHPLPGYQELHPAHRRAKGHRCRHARRIP